MKTITKTRQSKSPPRTVDEAPQKTRYLERGARIWATKWGGGIGAKEVFLISDGLPLPRLIALCDSFESARAFLDCKIGLYEVVDLTSYAHGMIPEKLGENLLFPINLRTGMLDADVPMFAAAHFILSPISREVLAFVILSIGGLRSVAQDIERAQDAHRERMERLAR